jgi:heat shock protein HslJ
MKIARIITVALMLLAAVFPIASCQSIASPLEDFNWVCYQYGPPGGPKTPLADTQLSAHFDSKTKMVTGSGGINDFSANYTVERLTITIGIMTFTKMGGSPENMAQENAYFNLLKNVNRFEMEQGRLILFNGENRLYFKQTDVPLKTVTHWGE